MQKVGEVAEVLLLQMENCPRILFVDIQDKKWKEFHSEVQK